MIFNNNHIYIVWNLAIIFLVCQGCSFERGRWEPIHLSQDSFVLSAEEHALTITCDNYSYWINSVDIDDEYYSILWDDEIIYTDPDTHYTCYKPFVIQWLTIDYDSINVIMTINVAKNLTGKERRARISIEAGDAFATINITQAEK